jgi:hypothetical protein
MKYSSSSLFKSEERRRFGTRMKEKRKRAKNRLAHRDVFFFNSMDCRNFLPVLATNPPPFFEILESETQG